MLRVVLHVTLFKIADHYQVKQTHLCTKSAVR